MPRDLLLYPNESRPSNPVPSPAERLIQRGATGRVHPHMTHRNNKGKRVPGWEEVDFEKLARAMNMSSHHVRMGVTARDVAKDRGVSFTLKHLIKAADLLGLSMSEVGARIDYTRKVDSIRSEEGVDWHEANARLEGRKTDGQLRREQRAARPMRDVEYPKTKLPISAEPIANRKGF